MTDRTRDPDDTLHLFVVGLSEYQRGRSETLLADRPIELHSLVPMSALRGVRAFPVERLLNEARRRLDRFEGEVAGILSFVDFPAIEMAAILAAERGLPGPSPQGVMSCNHKYWQRLVQRDAAPETTPRFALVDPFAPDPLAPLEGVVPYPFWVKPLNAYRSQLGFKIEEPDDFHSVLPRIRRELPRLADPLEYVMRAAGAPDDLLETGGRVLLAEEIMGGEEYTLEGYIHRGETTIYGVVDSVLEPNHSSFARYEYPSDAPAELQERMHEPARRLMRELPFDNGAFNMEIFHDEEEDHLWILEVNPRVSQSHFELFHNVDGVSHQKVAIDLALGREPSMPHREGRYAVAGKFFMRAWTDAVVRRVPDATELRAAERGVPGTSVLMQVREGDRLSRLVDQDSYSYELAWVWVGADSREEMVGKYRRIVEALDIELDPIHRDEPGSEPAP